MQTHQEHDLKFQIRNRLQKTLSKASNLFDIFQPKVKEEPVTSCYNSSDKLEFKPPKELDSNSTVAQESSLGKEHEQTRKVHKTTKSKRTKKRNISRDTAKLLSAVFSCPVCKDNKKITRSQLKEHYVQHGILRPSDFGEKKKVPVHYRCETCSENFGSKHQLRKHMGSHENHFFCEVCTAGFKKLIDLLIHAQIHSKDKLFRCALCKFTTDKRGHIRDHLYTQHEPFRKYKCGICNKGFSLYSCYEKHMDLHAGADEKPYQCDVCGVKYMYLQRLNLHKSRNHKVKKKKVFECAVCKKQFSLKQNLKRHMRQHVGQPTMLCEICGKQLSSRQHLKLHLRIHTGYKPHACDVCGKAFSNKCTLTLHKRVHSREKPYACKECGKCFSQRSTLVIHGRYHTGERPYSCPLCKKGFVAKGLVGMHLKSCSRIRE